MSTPFPSALNSSAEQSGNKPNAEEVIDLRQYIKVINKYKWRIVLLAFTVAALAAVVALNITPQYRATATLLIEADQAKAVSFEEIYGLDSNRKEYYLTQFEILKSRNIAQAVVQKLNLKNHQDFLSEPSFVDDIKALKDSIPFIPKKEVVQLSADEQAAFELQELVNAFSERLTISPVRKTQLVNITYESSDPKMAALVANTVGEVYIEQNMNAKMGLTQKAAGWLTTRLSDLRVRLDASEGKLQAYRERENLVDVEGVLGLVSQELEQTSGQLVVTRNEMNKLQSIVRVIDEYGRDDIDRLESITEITSHPVIQNVKQTLIAVEQKVSELGQEYGPKHPMMIAANAELATVKQNLTEQVKRLVTGVEKELNSSKRNVTALEAELVRIRAQYQQLTAKEFEYRKLSREVDTNRKIYDTFFSRSKETEVTSDFNAAVARFTDRAFTPNIPAKPNKPLIVMLAFVAAIGLGIVMAFLVEALNDTFKSAMDIENKLSMRMLGLLPLVSLAKNSLFDVHHFYQEQGRSFAESVRTLRTSFVLTQLDKQAQVLAVTSSVPGEGKSTVATNLAFALGQLDKTILVDADMRKPSIGKRFGIEPYHPGLSNFIAGTATLEECIYHDETSGISVMPCGFLPPNPLELLASARFNQVLEQLKANFDRVLFDTAPLQAVSDSLVIARQVDTVIYVVKSDDTRIGVVKACLGRLVASNARIGGVVLNQVDTKKMDKHDYYHGYYSEYSYGDVQEASSKEITSSNVKPLKSA
ncbi:chain-length determining protein [Shewanella hanedai]|uniref:non-specific protein-tyrosine kinase n=1 Tax=Shewanella hanedai TaxID=25 RepID=A0A553JML1_SHEHA|nr:polysaccharide biosynthesis tyrosine autokinase [Shewanella hanedai]TRY13696.1 polysaccharide biosynthesis tyrosine autokinase [Shewanella hanedai]GGI98735.1 chain-length determining protein [Shewanella hanedai]